MTKRAAINIFISVMIVFGALGMAYTLRGTIRELSYNIQKPTMPAAQEYVPMVQDKQMPTREENIKASTTSEPFVETQKKLPAEINLAVPFLLQAPKQNWVQPFEDACEEASLIMVDAYYRGRKTAYDPDEGIKAILDVVAYEDETYGYNKDTTANEVKNTALNYFKRPRAEIVEATEEQIKNALAKGHPVIAPVYGKGLQNPNFRNGGPEYHMLVIKGYTKDGQWITNEPGTRRGADYLYPKQRLLDAIHDFDQEDMKRGRKVVIIIE